MSDKLNVELKNGMRKPTYKKQLATKGQKYLSNDGFDVKSSNSDWILFYKVMAEKDYLRKKINNF